MKVYPQGFWSQIEFDRIRQILVSYAFSDDAKVSLASLVATTDFDKITLSLDELAEYVQLSFENDGIPLHRFDQIQGSLDRLRVEGYVLELEEIVVIGEQLHMVEGIIAWNTKSKTSLYPHLVDVVEACPELKDLLKTYRRVIDSQGEVRPDASPKLVRIVQSITDQERRVNGGFDRAIQKYADKGWLSDSQETYRNGRRVLSVKAEYKRQISGIIHGESGGGRLVFVEPQDMVQLNNELAEWFEERRKEVYRILKELCAHFAQYLPELAQQYQQLVYLDVLRAKGELAIALDARRPELSRQPCLRILELRHPLLYLKNRKAGIAIVPLDVQLHGKNRILLISGPNAGGKSITLKGVGLSQVMLQAGLLVPVAEQSVYGIFESFFADIGDQQSIDESLSTYSSRLAVMRDMLELATPQSLILIDEFGSGTDPMLGAALAESVLREFHKKQLWGVITTHYSNLKIFALRTKGIVNAGMLFDKATLEPTYRLKIGKPGSSYAYEIAKKMGLPDTVISYAQRKTEHSALEVEKILNNLNADQQKMSEIKGKLEEDKGKLEKLIKSYEELKDDLDHQKRKLKLDRKENQFDYEERLRSELDKMAREVKKASKEQDASKALDKIRKTRDSVHLSNEKTLEEILDLSSKLEAREGDVKEAGGPIAVGSKVRIIRSGVEGLVREMQGDKLWIEVGSLTMETNIKQVIALRDSTENKPTMAKPVFAKEKASISLDTRLDIRGMGMSDAMNAVQRFLDHALVSNAYEVTIIHGIGTGALKKLVRTVLQDYKDVREVRHPSHEQGGQGATIIRL